MRVKTRQLVIVSNTPADAFDQVSFDILDPLPITPKGTQYVLTMQDKLAKYCIAVTNQNKCASTVTDASVREGTQFAPHDLIFCQSGTSTTSFPSNTQLKTYGSYLQELVTHIADIRARARDNLIKAKERSKTRYGKKVNVKNFNVGDMVFVLEEPKKCKLGPCYCGPFPITKTLDRNNCEQRGSPVEQTYG